MFNIGKMKSSNIININGKSISVQGNNISIVNNKVYVDGKLVEEGLTGDVKITFEGELANLDSSASVTVNGNVKGDIDASGSVTVYGDVGGDVDASGSVTCGNVGGDVDASGSVSFKR